MTASAGNGGGGGGGTATPPPIIVDTTPQDYCKVYGEFTNSAEFYIPSSLLERSIASMMISSSLTSTTTTSGTSSPSLSISEYDEECIKEWIWKNCQEELYRSFSVKKSIEQLAISKAKSRFKLLDKIGQAQRQFLVKEEPKLVFSGLLDCLLEMMESDYGFIGELQYDEDGSMYLLTRAASNIAWNAATREFYEENIATYNGLQFRNMDSLFGHVLVTGEVVIANEPRKHHKSCGIPEGHPPLTHFLGIPFFVEGGTVISGMVGIANKPGGYCQEDVDFLEPLVVTCSNLIQAYNMNRENEFLINKLEDLVVLRTNELQLANQKVIESAKMQIEHFACMSHEIRTPLNCVIGLSSLLQETELNPFQADALQMIIQSGELLLAVVNDVLDYSKLQTDNMPMEIHETSLQAALDAVVHSIDNKAKEKKLKFKTYYDVSVPDIVKTDSRRLQQILYNLLGNAIKFSRDEGDVELSVLICTAEDGAVFEDAYQYDDGALTPYRAPRLSTSHDNGSDHVSSEEFYYSRPGSHCGDNSYSDTASTVVFGAEKGVKGEYTIRDLWMYPNQYSRHARVNPKFNAGSSTHAHSRVGSVSEHTDHESFFEESMSSMSIPPASLLQVNKYGGGNTNATTATTASTTSTNNDSTTTNINMVIGTDSAVDDAGGVVPSSPPTTTATQPVSRCPFAKVPHSSQVAAANVNANAGLGPSSTHTQRHLDDIIFEQSSNQEDGTDADSVASQRLRCPYPHAAAVTTATTTSATKNVPATTKSSSSSIVGESDDKSVVSFSERSPTALEGNTTVNTHLHNVIDRHGNIDFAAIHKELDNSERGNTNTSTLEEETKDEPNIDMLLDENDLSTSKYRLRFVVKDYGKGISKSDFAKIFQPFQQVSSGNKNVQEGTGLGLAITSRLIKGLGGVIRVDSEVGKWSKFTLELPLRGEPVMVDSMMTNIRNIRVLLVNTSKGESLIEKFIREQNIECIHLDNCDQLVNYTEVPPSAQQSSGSDSSNTHVTVCMVEETLYKSEAYKKLSSAVRTVLLTFGPKYFVKESNCHFRSLFRTLPSVIFTTLDKCVTEARNKTLRKIPITTATRPSKKSQTKDGPTTITTGSSSSTTERNFENVSVMIAEDNLVNQKVLCQMLKRLGLTQIDVVDNGLKAVELEKTKRFDIILMDMQMPVMGGCEASRIIVDKRNAEKRKYPHVVFVTAHATSEFETLAKDAGGSGFISKPFNIQVIRTFFQALPSHVLQPASSTATKKPSTTPSSSSNEKTNSTPIEIPSEEPPAAATTTAVSANKK